MGKLFPSISIFILALFYAQFGFSQSSSLRKKVFTINADTLTLDTLSIAPGSLLLLINGDSVSSQEVFVDYVNGKLVVPKKHQGKQLKISYRVFPIKLNKPVYNKSTDVIQQKEDYLKNPFLYTYEQESKAPWELTGLSKQGSISRGVSFGNNQNLSVNSNLNLQLEGKLTEDISVLAAISDENIPIQPEGNTQQLQDFDQVYIQVFNDNSKLTAGDFTLEPTDSYFMRYFKRAQGGSFETTVKTTKKTEMDIQASAAISRGKFARNIIQGVEGNQGPYRLRGSEGEQFIVVLSGTERIYIDGKLLVRGQENDYVINYNTAEITFTARQLITKDKRIIVEFQYSVLNYQRSLFQFSDKWKSENWNMKVNFYSEQDNRNQPIQQEIDDADREKLRNIGDNLNDAIVSSVDTASFNENRVLYAISDTVVNGFFYDSIFTFSQSQEIQLYSLSFSEVGFGNGNYIQSNSIANGRVYQWVPPDPISGQPTGNFEPVVLLETPKQQQMLTFGGEWNGKNQSFSYEGALTNNDLNTFSEQDAQDDYGAALKMNWKAKKPIGKKEDWQLKTGVDIEFWNRNFREIERVRTVEFYRDWNLRNVQLNQDQRQGAVSVGIEKGDAFDVNYRVNGFNAGVDFQGIKNDLSLKTNTNGLKFDYAGSLLNSEGSLERTDFYQHNTLATQQIRKVVVGYKDDLENNLRRSTQTDTLLSTGYRFFEYEVFLTNPDTMKNRYRLFYTQRRDAAAKNDQITLSTYGETYGASFDLLKNPKSTLRGKTMYRTLLIRDSTLTNDRPENTFLNRLEYTLRLWKGALVSTSFYEISSGLEARREFTFIQVAAGQGTFTWNDYNDNGIKELDEFEIAVFQDQANYIKVFYPTDDYVRTFGNQFNQTLFFNPSAVWRSKTGLKKLAARFSDQVAYRMDRKTNDDNFLNRINPVLQEYQIADSNLISVNSSLRNSLFFNRTAPVFGAEFTFQDIRSKTLLTNGFSSRTNESYTGKTRLNFNQFFALQTEATTGQKANLSDFFNRRDFTVEYLELEPKISFQPSTSFRFSVFFRYKEKQNLNNELFDNFGELITGGETAFFRTVGVEGRTASAERGNLNVSVNYIAIAYNGPANSPVAFEMLEALQNGQNLTWNVYYQRTLANNLQVDINYNGRAAEGSKTIHTGGVQVRAFF